MSPFLSSGRCSIFVTVVQGRNDKVLLYGEPRHFPISTKYLPPGGGGGCSHWEAYAHARMDRVLFSQLLVLQRVRV